MMACVLVVASIGGANSNLKENSTVENVVMTPSRRKRIKMALETVTVGVKLPKHMVQRLDDFAKLKEYPSRSAVMVRACEFFLAEYRPKRTRPQSARILDLERGLRQLLNKASLERRLADGSYE